MHRLTGIENNYAGWSNGGGAVNHDQHTGSFSLQVSAAGSTEQLVTGLQPSTTYTLKAWVKTTSGSTGKLGAKNFGGTEINSSTTSGTYTQLSITFTTGSTNTSAKIYLWNAAGTGLVFGDDFELRFSS